MNDRSSPLTTLRGTLILAALIVGLLASTGSALGGRGTPPVAIISTNSPVDYGQPIVLDGGRSRVDLPGRIVEYSWTLLTLPGNGAFPPDRPFNTRNPIVEIPISALDPFPLGSHRFQLVVTDDSGNNSAPAITTVIVRDTVSPTAILDVPTSVTFGQDILLEGDRSFDGGGGQIFKYTWTLLGSDPAENMIPNQPVQTQTPSFTVAMGPGGQLPLGSHQFQLVVTDDSGNNSVPAITTVIVRDNVSPTAILDVPTSVNFGQDILLEGDRSFDGGGGQIFKYTWTLLGSDPAENMIPNQPVQTQTPSFTVAMGPGGQLPLGSHQFQLVVTDDSGNNSVPAITTVIVRDNVSPTAILDVPTSVNFGQDILLEGDRSFDGGGGQIFKYTWTLLSDDPADNILPNQPVQTQTPSFTVAMGPGGQLPLGSHQFQLVVTDDSGNNSVPAITTVIVRDTVSPTAILDVPTSVNFGQDILLEGDRSFDGGGGQIFKYTWTLLSDDPAENMTPNQPVQTQTPSFTVAMGPGGQLPLGSHQFQLVVTDDSGNNSVPAITTVIVRDTVSPTAILDVPTSVTFGEDILIEGDRSFDGGGGQIFKYTWTLLGSDPAENMTPNQPVQTQTPSFTVAMGPGGQLPLGSHQFQLLVTDDSGNNSAPVTASVIVEDIPAPEFVPELSFLKVGDRLTVIWNRAPPEFRTIEVWKSTDLDRWQLETTLPGSAITHTLSTPRTGPLFVRLVFLR